MASDTWLPLARQETLWQMYPSLQWGGILLLESSVGEWVGKWYESVLKIKLRISCSSYLISHQLPSTCFHVNLNRHFAFIKLNTLSPCGSGWCWGCLSRKSLPSLSSLKFLTLFGLPHSSWPSWWRPWNCRLRGPGAGLGGGTCPSGRWVPPACLQPSFGVLVGLQAAMRVQTPP